MLKKVFNNEAKNGKMDYCYLLGILIRFFFLLKFKIESSKREK